MISNITKKDETSRNFYKIVINSCNFDKFKKKKLYKELKMALVVYDEETKSVSNL